MVSHTRQEASSPPGADDGLNASDIQRILDEVSDAADILGHLRDHLLRAGGELVGDAFLASAGLFPKCHVHLL
jgi:hypothetical protein